ncbi:MAG: hypothetical protein LBC78_02280, partial [Oscillospiraceae bacterium]|nr:hypothetical protein [Oscillospiraceae bacterium]
MDREQIRRLVDDFSDNSPTNYLRARAPDGDTAALGDNNFARNNVYGGEEARRLLGVEPGSKYENMRFYQKPIFSIGRADDPAFEKLKDSEAVGAHHMSPEEWMPGAKTVISFFVPFERATVEANKLDPEEPAIEWLFTRVDGQQHLLALGAAVRDAFIASGYNAVTPYTEDKYV